MTDTMTSQNSKLSSWDTLYMSHYNPQHVSNRTLLIFRRTNCIITAFVIVTLRIGKRSYINHLTHNGHYMGRTAQLTSRCCILYIYSTNIRTEYFKHAV